MKATDERSDTELLRAYALQEDERAFAELAARHVDMIFSVSLRRSGNRQLAMVAAHRESG